MYSNLVVENINNIQAIKYSITSEILSGSAAAVLRVSSIKVILNIVIVIVILIVNIDSFVFY